MLRGEPPACVNRLRHTALCAVLKEADMDFPAVVRPLYTKRVVDGQNLSTMFGIVCVHCEIMRRCMMCKRPGHFGWHCVYSAWHIGHDEATTCDCFASISLRFTITIVLKMYNAYLCHADDWAVCSVMTQDESYGSIKQIWKVSMAIRLRADEWYVPGAQY